MIKTSAGSDWIVAAKTRVGWAALALALLLPAPGALAANALATDTAVTAMVNDAAVVGGEVAGGEKHDDGKVLPIPASGRRLGESCFFGAGAGAASTLLASAPLIGQSLTMSGALAVALGAAGVGCTVGFAGAAAASGYNYLWDQGWFGGQPAASSTPLGHK